MCLKGEKVENTCEGDSGKFHRKQKGANAVYSGWKKDFQWIHEGEIVETGIKGGLLGKRFPALM